MQSGNHEESAEPDHMPDAGRGHRHDSIFRGSNSMLGTAAWVVVVSVFVVLACDGIRYFRTQQALERGVSSMVEAIEARPYLLESLAFARPSANDRYWAAFREYEGAAVKAGTNAAIEAGGVTDPQIGGRAQLISFVTSSPFWKQARRTTFGAALIRPGECAGGREIAVSACRFRRLSGDASTDDSGRHVTVLMAARFSGLIPLYPPIAVQSSREVRVR